MLILLLGTLMIFGALFMTFAAFGSMSGQSHGVARSIEMLEGLGTSMPSELTSELERPFGERVLDPLLKRFQKLGRRISGADQEDRIRAKLDRAGNPAGWTVDRVLSGRILGAIVGTGGAVYFWLILGFSMPKGIIVTAIGLVLGFQAPLIWLYNIATKRDVELQKSLADAIDLMTISVEAGLGFDAALQQVARNTEGPLAGELQRVLQEVQIGRSRSDALRALGDRTKIADIRSFVSSMVQADAFGIPIGQVLRVQSNEIRMKRRQRAEEKAAQVPVKIMIPVILFILPCLLLTVMGPAIISVRGSF
ncbi:MAG: type II secretion system F family protein [Nocardioides sp.]